PWHAHRDGRVTGNGAEPGRTVPEVPARAESGAVVESGGGPRAVGVSGGPHLRLRRNGRDWARRYPGAAAGREAQGHRPLARSHALLAFPYGNGPGVGLALGAAVQRDS